MAHRSPGSVLPSVFSFHFPFWQVGLHHYPEFHLLAPSQNENIFSFNYLWSPPLPLQRPGLKWDSKKYRRIRSSKAHRNQPCSSSCPLRKMNAKVSSSLGNWVVVAMVMAVHCDGTAGIDVSCRVSPWLLRLELTSPRNIFTGWSPIILSPASCPSLHPWASILKSK